MHCSHKPSWQHNYSGGKRRRRKVTKGTKTGVLHLRGPHTIQAEISPLSEAGNGNLLGITEAYTLFPRPFHHSCIRRSSSRYHEQQILNGKNCKMEFGSTAL